MTLFRTTSLPKTKGLSTPGIQSAQQSTVGGPTGYQSLAPSQSHTGTNSQAASVCNDKDTPYPPGHHLAPEGEEDQYGGYAAMPNDETTVAALLTGSDVSKPELGGSTRNGKKL